MGGLVPLEPGPPFFFLPAGRQVLRLRKMVKKKRGGMNLAAWVISRVFDPVVEIPLLLAAVTFVALNNGLRWRFLIFLMICDALLPAVYMLWGLATKRISDWDMTKRGERSGIYFFTIFCHLFGVVFAYLLGKVLLAKILFIFWSLAVVVLTRNSPPWATPSGPKRWA